MHRWWNALRCRMRVAREIYEGLYVAPYRSLIYREYRRGRSVAALAGRFGRTRTSIYRTINEMRARRILDLPLDYVPNEEFDLPAPAARAVPACR